MKSRVNLANIKRAASSFGDVVLHTPLMLNPTQSSKYAATVRFKREDLQVVRSYKIRGAFHKINSLTQDELANGVVCASAGNHAQGVALSCAKKGVRGVVFMPSPTPNQKIEQVKMFGGELVDVILTGDTFDEASASALKFCEEQNMTFVHPFDDEKVIEGQGTIGFEILEDAIEPIDYLFVPVGGGGLASGLSAVFKMRDVIFWPKNVRYKLLECTCTLRKLYNKIMLQSCIQKCSLLDLFGSCDVIVASAY